LAGNDAASLVDMGDGVMLLEFHSKANSLDTNIFEIMKEATDRLHGNASGLVIANEGRNFSVGANILNMAIATQSGMWKEIEMAIREGQETLMALRRAPKPVVAAPHQMALGGGCETSMAADRIVAHGELYMGLVEVGVGLVPGWGGCKEMVRRRISPHMFATNVNPTPFLRQAFETVGFAKVSTSAAEARELGFLSDADRIVLNRDHLLAEAKREVLTLLNDGYVSPITTGNCYAAGRDVLAAVNIEVYSMAQGGFISEYDAHIAKKLGYILCGGELSSGQWMDEQYFLDLEAEGILSLLGQEKTQKRIWFMLENNKPLRN
jgi:3-hydroxyacyl-CoA dehydrogenase